MHYAESGDALKPLVVFVHGSPGSLSAFIEFLTDSTLLTLARLVAVDRPGFGYSGFGYSEPSLKKQCEYIRPILEKYRHKTPVILVGHSFGGPVVARMAMEFPELVDGLVLVAAALDPQLEPDHQWIRGPLATPFLGWILPRAIRVSNKEIYKLKPELERMIPMYGSITCPVTILHGTNDNLVHVDNAHFARQMLVNAPVQLVIEQDVNHYIPWKYPEMIRDALIRILTPKPDFQVSVE